MTENELLRQELDQSLTKLTALKGHPNASKDYNDQYNFKTMQKPNSAFEHLTEAASQLVMTIKTPAAFLEFISEMLEVVHNYEVERAKNGEPSDYHFNVNQFIEHIIQPWFAGGPALIGNIAEGIKKMYEEFGEEDYCDALACVFSAVGKDLSQGVPGEEDQEKLITGIKALMSLGNSLRLYRASLNSGGSKGSLALAS